jgi:hypothetical protein
LASNNVLPSEFRAYADTRDDLKSLGWNTASPGEHPQGQVYEQREYRHDGGLAEALGSTAPENVVVVDPLKRIFWAIEVKRNHNDLEKAVDEARGYAEAISTVDGQDCPLYTGVAGSPIAGYVRRTYFRDKHGEHALVNFEGAPITALLSLEQALEIIEDDSPSLSDLELEDDVLLGVAKDINETLHAASVNKGERAAAVASILLTMSQGNLPSPHLDPQLYVDQINASAEAALSKSGQGLFARHIQLSLPQGQDARIKFVGALARTADALRHLNISAAMKSGTDVLGKFYEAFLAYGNAAKDIGIVLTPRHVTRWASEILRISVEDIVYDPTCGTGGFLVSAFDYVRENEAEHSDFEYFRKHRIFGIEQQPKIAALAVTNMIFRGDGSSNIIDDDALRRSLVYAAESGSRTAEFRGADTTGTHPGATKVLMNPPFSLKKSDEKEYEFVSVALEQLEANGLLFAVLPAPIFVKGGAPLAWRRDRLLAENTLRAVVAFPEDLFYPVSIDTVGVVIQKGRPHKDEDEVIWALAKQDGMAKVKGKRLPSERVHNMLELVGPDVADFIENGRPVESVPGLIKSARLDRDDPLVELLPQVYLDEPLPEPKSIQLDFQHAVREYLALVLRTGSSRTLDSVMAPMSPVPLASKSPHSFSLWSLTDLFGSVGQGITRGSIHAMNTEDSGQTPVISSSTESNGILGFFDLSEDWPRRKRVITVASNGTPLTSYFHPYEMVAKDDLFVCEPPAGMTLSTIFYVIIALNGLTWRFSYYRKCYLNKIDKVKIYMPIDSEGEIDQEWIVSVAESCLGWKQLSRAIDTWQPEPWRALGRRTWNS